MKNLTLLSFSFLVMMFLSSSQLFAFSGGTGTKADPFQVATPEDLEDLHTAGDWTYFILTSDIDMSGRAWVPLTSSSHATMFKGSIDGDGYVIKNLTITESTGAPKIGFIVEHAGGCYIKNLGFVNLVVDAPKSTPVGGIIAYSWAGQNRLFENNWIESGSITGYNSVGALAGWMFVKETTEKTQYVNNCYAGAGVTVHGNKEVGGLFGKLSLQSEGLCNDFGFFGTVTADSSAAAISGSTAGSVTDIPNSFYFDSSKNDSAIFGDLPQGMIAQGNAVGLSSAELTDVVSFPEFDFATVWTMGTNHPVFSAPVVASDTLISLMTSKHDNDTTPTGGYYSAGDTVEFTVTYASNVDSKLNIVFKDGETFIHKITPSVVIDLPTSNSDTVEYTVKVQLADTVSYRGTSRISGYLGSWVLGSDKYEYIEIGSIPSAINIDKAVEFTAYPNPSCGVFNITLSALGQVSVYDLSGCLVMCCDAPSGLSQLNIKGQKPGLYLLTVQTVDGLMTKKIQVK